MGALALLLATACGSAGAAEDAFGKVYSTGSSDAIVGYINEQIRQGWTDNEVQPSPPADDAEWIRRVYLDIAGHIPPAEKVAAFIADEDPAKRSKLIDELLDSPDYIRHWTAIWTNLCIGRRTPDEVSRLGMTKFFRESFAKNRPWNEIVYDLVAAEGHYVQNGAVNYLLAQMQMPDEGVQATAHVTRLFMGIQVQCTQCHNHPFNEWQQNQFWEFNSFFRQLDKNAVERYDARSGQMVLDYVELNQQNLGSPEVFYEKRSGLMQVAYPKFFETEVDPGVNVNRREKLAELMTRGESQYVARAMVNRMWGHFFGYGFTRPIDDMGPHNPASHPDLLDRLTDEFVQSNYDVKQLMRWIANAEAYNLTSRFGKGNEIDSPAAGNVPLFSHMYIKVMSPEQLYDSLIIATDAHKSGRTSWDAAEQQRQQWMQQFVIAFDTDEADEITQFNGTIPQALMMMNSELIQNAVNTQPGSYLHDVLAGRGTDRQKVETLFLATLGREPSRRETTDLDQIVRGYPNRLDAFQDVFWALLNSNEFILNH
jgi:hypothetical protein